MRRIRCGIHHGRRFRLPPVQGIAPCARPNPWFVCGVRRISGPTPGGRREDGRPGVRSGPVTRSVRLGTGLAPYAGCGSYRSIHFPTDELLIEIAIGMGHQLLEIRFVRCRGRSAQQMGDYGRQPSGEACLPISRRRIFIGLGLGGEVGMRLGEGRLLPLMLAARVPWAPEWHCGSRSLLLGQQSRGPGEGIPHHSADRSGHSSAAD